MKKIFLSLILISLLILLTACDNPKKKLITSLLYGSYQTAESCLPNIYNIIFYKDGTLEIDDNNRVDDNTIHFYKYEKSIDYELNKLVSVKNDEETFSFQFNDDLIYFPFKIDDVVYVCRLVKKFDIPVNPHYEGD